MKSNRIKKLSKIEMVEKYRYINKFRYSIFTLTNPSMSMELNGNPIMGEIVLDKLKEIKQEIELDIDNITPEDIKADDIFGERKLEVSKLITTNICMFDIPFYEKKYKQYLKGKRLERVFTIDMRNKEIQSLNQQIEELERIIVDLESIDEEIANDEKRKLKKLELEKREYIERFNFPPLEEIEDFFAIKVNGYLNIILEDIDNNIDYLERNIA